METVKAYIDPNFKTNFKVLQDKPTREELEEYAEKTFQGVLVRYTFKVFNPDIKSKALAKQYDFLRVEMDIAETENPMARTCHYRECIAVRKDKK